MNKDIGKYIANCAYFAKEKKPKFNSYPLQMTEIPDRPFDKISIDLVTWNVKHQHQAINTY